ARELPAGAGRVPACAGSRWRAAPHGAIRPGGGSWLAAAVRRGRHPAHQTGVRRDRRGRSLLSLSPGSVAGRGARGVRRSRLFQRSRRQRLRSRSRRRSACRRLPEADPVTTGMAPGGPLSVAINASLDPYAAGGVQANLNGLIRTLRQRPASSAMTLLAAPVTTESWKEIGGDVFSVVPWPFPLAWYREPMQGRSPTLAEMLRALRHRLGRTSLKQHDDFLRRLGVDLVHF